MQNNLNEELLRQRQKLQGMARGFRQSQILFTCVRLGVFDALSGRCANASEIAEIVGADDRGIELLLNAAVSLGLLEKISDQYSNANSTETLLTSSVQGSIVPRLQLESAFYQRWGRLEEAVSSGKRPDDDHKIEQPDDWIRKFVYGLYNNALPIATTIAESILLQVDRPLRLIDVGGCHGAYSMALVQRYPLMKAIIFELPRVVPVAKEIIEKAGFSERVKVQEGDFQKEPLGFGYDVALVFGVLNGEPLRGRPALIQKVFDALNPGGLIVLRDFVLDPDRAGPSEAAIFALQMLLATDAGGLDTRDDWEMWLKSAGFSSLKIVSLQDWVGSSLVIATKPAS